MSLSITPQGYELTKTQEAIRAIFEHKAFIRQVLSYVVRAGVPEDSGEDCLSYVFETIIRRASGFDPSKGSLKAWVTGTAKLLPLEWRRSKKGGGRPRLEIAPLSPFEQDGDEGEIRPEGQVADGGETPDQQFAGNESRRIVQEFLNKQLTAEERQLLELYDVQEMDSAAVGRLLGLSAQTVRQRVSRLHERMRDAILADPKAREAAADMRRNEAQRGPAERPRPCSDSDSVPEGGTDTGEDDNEE